MASETSGEAANWLAQVGPELDGADQAWRTGNAGRGRVGARRAAGMALKAWISPTPRPDYGTSFMHHLNALADDTDRPAAVREAAWRLSARPVPEGGFQIAPNVALTPMDDARAIIAWVEKDLRRLSGAP